MCPTRGCFLLCPFAFWGEASALTTGRPGSGPPSERGCCCLPLGSAKIQHAHVMCKFIAGSEAVELKEETAWDAGQDSCLQTSVGQLRGRERDQKDRAGGVTLVTVKL